MANERFNFIFEKPPQQGEGDDDEGAFEVQCPACRGGKRCSVMGAPEFDCPLCEGEGKIDFNELLELIVETLCLHTRLIGD